MNRLPVPSVCTVATTEDISANVPVTGTDPDGNGLQIIVEKLPTIGKLYTNSTGVAIATGTTYTIPDGSVTAAFYYTPNLHLYGSDSFQYYLTDGCARSASVSCSISVAFFDYPPTVTSISTSTNENVNLVVTMVGSDIETASNKLVYSITSLPDPNLGVLQHVSTKTPVVVNELFTAGENTVLFVPVQYACCDIAQFTYLV